VKGSNLALKYKYAIYRDSNNDIKEIYPDDLKNLSISEKINIKKLELYDEDEEYRIFPRFNEQTPHFYCRSKTIRTIDKNRLDKSKKHDDRIDDLINDLKSVNTFKIGYYTFDKNLEEKYFETLLSIKDYSWDKEVHRIISSDSRVIHDIFGAELSLSMSQKKPNIAIEVVKTHFPEKNTFEKLLKLSEEFPLLIIFDFTIKKNYYFQVKSDENLIRISHYICNGSLWDRDKELNITTQEYALEYFKKNNYLDYT
jgi:hypothetical protein